MPKSTNYIGSCPCCNSKNVIHFGKTHKGTKRFRCLDCGKTWSDYEKTDCPCLEELVEEYLMGESYRDLQDKYHASARHLNERIRAYLETLPSWECYLDECVKKDRGSRLIHLIGLEFNCSEQEDSNKMFLAFAVDSISTLILGYEIDHSETKEAWLNLLDRLNCRGIVCPIFLSNGTSFIDEAIKTVFPQSTHLTQFYRTIYDMELENRLKLPYEMDNFLLEALASYKSIAKPEFREFSFMFKERNMKDILQNSRNYFMQRLETRINTRTIRRIEGLKENFIERFKAFRVLKENPYPLVNAWIALIMLSPLDIGYSRLSLYMQVPVHTSFKYYVKREIPKNSLLEEDSEDMRKFVIEIAIRGLQSSNFILHKEESFA